MRLKIKYCTLFLFIFLLQKGFTQTKIDSLQKKLDITTDAKTKVELLIKISDEYASTSPEKSLEFANQSLSIAKNSNDKKLEANAYFQKGIAYSYLYDDAKSLESYLACLKVREEIKDKKGIAEVYNSIALCYYYMNDFEKSIENSKKALVIAQENKNTKEQANAFYNIGNVYRKQSNNEIALNNYQQALVLYNKTKDINGVAKSHNSIGLIYFGIDKYDSAIYHYLETQKLRDESGDKKGAAITLNNIGNVYWRWSKYDKAIDYYQKALKIFEQIDFKKGIASCLNNIGLIYENLTKGNLYKEQIANCNKALEFHRKALATNKELGDQIEIANAQNNIGNVTFKIEEAKLKQRYGDKFIDSLKRKGMKQLMVSFDNVIKNYDSALIIFKKVNNQQGIASCLNNLGRVYAMQQDNLKALKNYEEALIISKELNNQYETALNLFQIGDIYKKMKVFDKSLQYFEECLTIANAIKLNELRKSGYENVAELYEVQNDFKNAYSNYKQFILVRDSIFNEDNYKLISELQTKYQTEKKEQQLKIANQEKKIQQQRANVFMFAMIIAVVILLVIVGFVFLIIKQNKQIKLAYSLLAEKNELISHQNKEIKDSINYARRIQLAILPPGDYIDTFFPDRFILFKPRDIVSGDFYWLTEHNGRIVIAAADCTGHGVPGAFMSMLGVAFLNEIVSKHEIVHASHILNDLRANIIKSLHQTGRSGESQDGMDIALYVIDRKNMMLEFAGANNPLIIVRNNEVIQYKGDKMPIGIHIKANEPFNQVEIPLQAGDCLYTFSDGYQDQFGGPDGKKFMIKNLKEVFLKIHKKPMPEQKEILDKNILDWIGTEHDQIDDILIIGVRI